MSDTATIEQEAEGEYRIIGLLNLKTIKDLRESGDQIIRQEPGQIQFNLSEAVVQGIAGLALLNSLVRTARNSGKDIIFTEPPASLRALAKAHGLASALSLGAA
jgi:ABC-type transporter Mla MlaB component